MMSVDVVKLFYFKAKSTHLFNDCVFGEECVILICVY